MRINKRNYQSSNRLDNEVQVNKFQSERFIFYNKLMNHYSIYITVVLVNISSNNLSICSPCLNNNDNKIIKIPYTKSWDKKRLLDT